MELEILGSWAGSPGPRSACSGYLLSEGSTKVLFDCGPGLVPILQEGHDPSDVAAIFISHMHADHSLDLVAYAYRLIRFTWRRGESSLARPIPLYLPPGGLSVLGRMTAAFGRAGNGRLSDPLNSAFAPAELTPARPIVVGDLAVMPYEVRHAVPAVGFRVEGPRSCFAYSGDTALCPGLTKLADGANLFVCEATARQEGPITELAGHLTARQAAQVASDACAERLVLTHVTRQDSEWLTGLVDDAREVYDGPVDVATTGLKVGVPAIHKDIMFARR